MCTFVVEDEDLLRMLLVETLEEAGYTVHQATSADEAIAMLANLTPRARALVTDIHMPGRHDGLQLAGFIRSHFPDIPVILTTGRPDAVDHLTHRQYLVAKPYLPSDVVQRIDAVLAGRQGQDPSEAPLVTAT